MAVSISMKQGLKVTLNGEELATISSDGLNMINVRVHGDRIGPELADLDISGGVYGEEVGKHLIWMDGYTICPGDEVAVTLLENTFTTHPGKSIEELYPEELEQNQPLQTIGQVFLDLAKEPKIRDGFSFVVTLPSGENVHFNTRDNDHGFGFSVNWAWLHSEYARVSLTSNTLAGVANRENGESHIRFRLECGQQVKICIH
jgi:hypothetical protein